jgi:hydrogenase nickel incorporation protein HypA/HybF
MADPAASTYFYCFRTAMVGGSQQCGFLMHEYGVALEIVERALARAGRRRIIKANVANGGLSGVNAESLALYCELVFREKQNDAVEITVVHVPVRFKCACGVDYSPGKILDPCPSCGGFDRVVVDGNQCTLESIEVEDE